jgi:hypothetical protein
MSFGQMNIRLGRVFAIQPGEGRAVALLIGLFFVAQAGSTIGSSGIQALFFARFGAEFLPPMFVALGVVTFVVSQGMIALLGRLLTRVPFHWDQCLYR